jgi:hypothetical protein
MEPFKEDRTEFCMMTNHYCKHKSNIRSQNSPRELSSSVRNTTTSFSSSSCTKWRKIQTLLFILVVPNLVCGGITDDNENENHRRPQEPYRQQQQQHRKQSYDDSRYFPRLERSSSTISSSSWSGMFYFWKDNDNRDDSTKKYKSIEETLSSTTGTTLENEFLDWGERVDDEEEDRNLKSGDRDSHDSHDEHDDFWRNPDYWDDYVGNNRDDDFYKYIGDPSPPSLLPLTRRDVIGFMFASLGVTLASSGGIGGGGLVVPCYIICIGMSPKQAIPLGSVTVLGGSLASLILNLRRRHPLADRPIIDWDLILVMEPVVLVGALFGAILHRVVSEKILSVLLVLLLSIVAHTTLAKARRMYDAERRYIEHLKTARSDYLSRVASFRTAFRMSEAGWSADALPGMDPESKTASYLPPSPTRTQSLDSRSINTTTPISPRMDVHERQRILILNPDFVTLRSDLLEEEKVTPRSKVVALCGKFSVLMFLNITLGGGAFRSPWGIECGGVAFWVVHVIMFAFLISSAWAAQVSNPHGRRSGFIPVLYSHSIYIFASFWSIDVPR